MAQQLADRVKETTTTSGTGAITLSGAMTGFRTFSSVCSVGDTCYYALQGVDGNGNPAGDWEVGLGTYSAASTLTRTTVMASSNSNAAVSLSGATYQVWMDYPASMLPLDSVSTASPNATVPVFSLKPNNATANVDVSIVPSGTGALLAAIPDGTATNGNKRGANAVDWSTLRATATQVAGGVGSVIGGGGRNTASGASYSTVGGGYTNVASSNYSTVVGGSTNTASGSYSTAVGGFANTASGLFSVAMGSFATTNSILGQVAMGFGSPSVLGQFQRSFTQLYATTTSTTAKVATANGASASTTNQLALRNKSAFRMRMTAVAFDATNFTDAKEWTAEVLITRGAAAASTAIVGSPTVTTTYATAGASGWTLAISADTTNGALQVTVTSTTTDTVDWNIHLDAIEVM